MTAELGFIHRFEAGTSDTTLLLLHGTGGNEHSLIGLARDLSPTAKLLSPRGKVLENGAPRFFRRLALGVFDEADLKAQAADLARFVQDAAERYGLAAGQVYALGYSNGANMAAALLLLHPEVLAGGVLLRPVLPLEPPALPDLSGKAAFLAAGRRDPWSPADRVEALAQRLRQGGAEVELRWQDAGHELHPEELEAARAWLARRV
ncbi:MULTISPECIES: alpha/beta hydrolase [unclassified Meiothermus]|uniref:alpha/beta hydrolase n=1 Tax=unclassified Meiothermus TaxID=370471 RepID=UPI000D7BB155|nr:MULTISPECIES: alpha/beta hydrolase [unclassified Meiothermus]PZA07580.1 alpha/beta hydrolase [Meiothermus sp. Pnk-1]RYM36796.1 alpha/beta hydrolase [Meiothermus sp. PNK-Is4]